MKKSKTTPAEFPPESRQRAPERDGKRKMKNNLPGIPPKHCLAASQGEKFRKQPRRNSASNFDFRHHRHVVGGAFPAAHGLQDGVAPDRAPAPANSAPDSSTTNRSSRQAARIRASRRSSRKRPWLRLADQPPPAYGSPPSRAACDSTRRVPAAPQIGRASCRERV